MIIDPQKNRIFKIWEIGFMLAIILECVLVPYTVCFDIETVLDRSLAIERTLDVVWAINVVLTFFVGVRKDYEAEYSLATIAKAYVGGDFLFDILSTGPSFFIGLEPKLYWVKCIRLFRISTVKRIVCNFLGLLGSIQSRLSK